jgi:hypothetical protein
LNGKFSEEAAQMADKKIHEEMSSILNHKGKSYLNVSEILSHPSQNGYHEENEQQMLVRKWGKKGHLNSVSGNVN